MNETLLCVKDLTVRFDGFTAIDAMNLEIMPKQIRVLIGPNGAGKSTLLDAIIGRVHPAAGAVFFQGEDITRAPEYKRVRKGICRKFQAPGILDSLTVAENLALSARSRRQWWRTLNRRPGEEVSRRVDEVLRLIDLQEKRDTPAAHLSHGQKQWLEIGMVVASSADLLLLDEPAAGMSHAEASRTAELIRRLADFHSILVIDHDMTFVAQLAAPVTVLHMGRILCEGTLEQVRQDARVAAVYLGRAQEANNA